MTIFDCSNLLHKYITVYVHTCDITCNTGCPLLYEMQYSNCGLLGGSGGEPKDIRTYIQIQN